MTGGSGHKSQKNSEGNKARNNRLKGDALLDDIMDEVSTAGVLIGKVTRRLGCGRMEIAHFSDKGELTLFQAPLRGGMRGRGKKDVWIDVGSVVLFEETGLGGMATHRILSVFTPVQIARYKSIVSDADPRLFLKTGAADAEPADGIEFAEDDEKEIDINDI